jgi:hypothetical protein
MRTSKRRLPVPQWEFGFASDTFNLFQETTRDGERIARERDEAERNRQLAEAAQARMFRGKPARKNASKKASRIASKPRNPGLNRAGKSEAKLALTVNVSAL